MSASPLSSPLSPDARMLNRVAQGHQPFAVAVQWFGSLSDSETQSWLKALALMCHQAHPQAEEVDAAIALADLKPTFTPCVMLRRAARPEHTFNSIASLPPEERQKSFRLLLALYCIADTRRRKLPLKVHN
jgi:hypothetical protein